MAFTIHTSEAFAKHIEKAVQEKHMSYLDAVIEFCNQHQLEPESLVPFINDKIKRALGQEAQKLHLMPKRRELPLDD